MSESEEVEILSRELLFGNNNNNKNNNKSTENISDWGIMAPPRSDDDETVLDEHNQAHDDIAVRSAEGSPAIWSPTGVWYRDFFHFVGPAWFVSIAYVDPGNFQADIQAGATSRYTLLFAVWWTTVLSIYVQTLCVRLAIYGQITLAEAQAKHCSSNRWLRYMNWAIAEFTAVITDLPEVIGIGIACNIFFGWPYYVGVMLSLLTTMSFLSLLNCGIRVMEGLLCVMVGIMSVALFVEMGFVGVDGPELMRGWVYGFVEVRSSDIFAITGILGAVVMPHNLYLHTAACQTRKVRRTEKVIKEAVKWSALEAVGPLMFSFFVNMAVVAIASESVFGSQFADGVGISTFCDYFLGLKGGCVFWAIALLAAGQSSAITTTFTGQYVMDGFLQIQLPVSVRAIVTRLIAITPCVIVSALLPNSLNKMINIVNSTLSFLLPFAFTPLVRYNCESQFMGEKFVTRGWERGLLYSFAFIVYLINAVALSVEGGGFFGDSVHKLPNGPRKTFLILLEVLIQLFYLGWNVHCVVSEIPSWSSSTTGINANNNGGGKERAEAMEQQAINPDAEMI